MRSVFIAHCSCSIYNILTYLRNIFKSHNIKLVSNFKMYQSIPSLTIPPGDPRGFARSHCPRGRVLAQLSLPGGWGFELDKFSPFLEEKCRNFSICFKETEGSLKSRCSVLFHINFCKNSVSRPILAISVILIKLSGHPRVIFADARSSIKF